MAIEVYQSSGQGNINWNYNVEAFEVASFFSQSAHFTIIDSYTTHYWNNYPTIPKTYGVLRFNGDPIGTDDPARAPGVKYWDTADDVGADNSWFVVRCDTTRFGVLGLPSWEVKIQWVEGGAFDDVSGLDYGNEGLTQSMFWRFAPRGGWDLAPATPDFTLGGGSYRSSPNHEMYAGTGGSGDAHRWFFVVDDGQIIRFNRRNARAYEARWFGGAMGDVITPPVPIGTGPTMPRVWLVGGQVPLTTVGNNTFLPEDSYFTSNPGVMSETYGGVSFEDTGGNWVETGYRIPDGQRMVNYRSQPNRHAAPNYQLDVLPYFVLANGYGLLGTMPLVGRTYGPGFGLFNNMNWLSMAGGYTPVFGWDGSTPLNF
jgi:hypothetical protein